MNPGLVHYETPHEFEKRERRERRANAATSVYHFLFPFSPPLHPSAPLPPPLLHFTPLPSQTFSVPDSLKPAQEWYYKAQNFLYGKTFEQAAATLVYLAIAPEIDNRPGGEYWESA